MNSDNSWGVSPLTSKISTPPLDFDKDHSFVKFVLTVTDYRPVNTLEPDHLNINFVKKIELLDDGTFPEYDIGLYIANQILV